MKSIFLGRIQQNRVERSLSTPSQATSGDGYIVTSLGNIDEFERFIMRPDTNILSEGHCQPPHPFQVEILMRIQQ